MGFHGLNFDFELFSRLESDYKTIYKLTPVQQIFDHLHFWHHIWLLSSIQSVDYIEISLEIS